MLLEEFLKPMGMPQTVAAKRMDMPTQRLNELIRGKRGMTADTAIRLAKLFGTTAEIWMDLQSRWDLWHAMRRLEKAS